METIIGFFQSAEFMPHGQCFLWDSDILWLHVISDTLIALAYYSIPLALIYFASRRTDLAYRWVFILFGAFILACGTTHAMAVWTIWNPDYAIQGIIKLMTAGISVATALMLWRVIPQALLLPSPANLQSVNQSLVEEIAERRQAKAMTRASDARLADILDIAEDAIIVVDHNQHIQLFNQGAEKVFGYSSQEIRGQYLEALLPRVAQHGLTQYVKDVEQSSEAAQRMGQHAEVYGRRKDGTEFPAEASFSKLSLDEGAMFTAILRDVTDRKKAEVNLRTSHDQLRDLTRQLERAREEERKHIAREVHDEFGQALTGLKFDLTWLKDEVNGHGKASQPAIAEKINSMTDLVHATIQTARHIARSLWPTILEDLGLVPAIRELVQDFQRRTGIQTTLTITPQMEDLPQDIEMHTMLYRACQEFLTNVVRHAQATEVSVELSQEGSVLVLKVQDNGCGITADQITQSQSLGIRGLRARVSFLGGDVSITGQPNMGTTIEISIPMENRV